MVAPEGYNIIKIPFASTTVESKNMIDFVSKYGIIIYKDRDGYDREIEFESPISNRYYGKVLYLLIPDDFQKCEHAPHFSFLRIFQQYSP